ncbi:MAG: hypothetical protein OXE44_14185 [Nitrospinae bacterium]|nr:hypothetical protein [Nitrospinota bacterium]
MKITAKQIADWAATGEARGELPRLIRKLLHAAGTLTQASMPAGDSVTLPGLDGKIFNDTDNAWVPKGFSVWEVSCRGDVTKKANVDYADGLDEDKKKVSPAERKKSVYVAVTARKWSKKDDWLEEKNQKDEWREVRAYDAEDLEQWLEEFPAVALEFGETLGLTGDGVESLSGYWSKWSTQCNPAITPTALLAGRTEAAELLLAKTLKQFEPRARNFLSIKADSVEEAAAFTATCLVDNPDLTTSAVIVTEVQGWRFIDKNPQIKVAISARPEITQSPSSRDDLVVLVPYASGDMSRHFPDVGGQADNTDIRLDRPTYEEFEKALVEIGVEPNKASRLSRNCGRSWTVFRRRLAQNPSIRKPKWLDDSSSPVLSTICLVGGWSSEQSADKLFVERIAGMEYSNVERELGEIGRLDDSPIIRLGGVWKAKSAIELLALFGEWITDEQLETFFTAAEEIFTTPDPQFELPDDERYMAVIHDKIRPQSELLIDSICDTLIKLAVRGPEIGALRAQNIKERVASLVRKLLSDADSTRWLSLSGVLPQLAEAAPSEFLTAIENSLSRPDAPVRTLIEETKDSALMGRCWYSGLLWALETLAWAPEWLTRISIILACLTETEVKGNWVHAPNRSLVSIFRSWLPQTAATIEQRIKVLEKLSKEVPDATYELLNNLVHTGHDFADHNPRPKWRDDDAEVGQVVTNKERIQMIEVAAALQMALAVGHPNRIVKLIEKLDDLDEARREHVFELIEPFTHSDVSDADKELLRSALRRRIHWHRNYDKIQGEELDSKLSYHEAAYQALEPSDLVLRYGWLFAKLGVALPISMQEQDHSARWNLIEEWRTKALREVFESEGWSGLTRIARELSGGRPVGETLSRLDIDTEAIADWIVSEAVDFEKHVEDAEMISGVLGALYYEHEDKMISLIKLVLSRKVASNWPVEKVAKFLALAPTRKHVWKIAAGLGVETDHQYWQTCSIKIGLLDKKDEFDYALQRFLGASRPRTAFALCRFNFEKTSANNVVEMLESIIRGEESEAGIPDYHDIQKALDYIEQSDAIEINRLLSLEFALIPLLGFGGAHHAKTLYHAIMSEPKLFTELLCILYKPRHRESDGGPSPVPNETNTQIAQHVLYDLKRQPGTAENGEVNPYHFASFIEQTRELCEQSGLLEVCDSTIGGILARGSEGSDGVFPFEPARDVLDRIEFGKMRNGFHLGCLNKRGVVSRGMAEGGEQERDLAQYYHKQAKALQTSHPRLANTLQELANSYNSDAHREDINAELRKEGIR